MISPSVLPVARSAPARQNRVGTVSLVVAVGGAAACHLGLQGGPFASATWLRIVAAGFEAATVGGFADWFAVTALFRHPLGLPIPHTAIIPTRRAKIIEGIVTMVEEDWLSPDVISARLARIAPSTLVVDWLRDPTHVERVSAPVRDVLRGLTPTLSGPEAVGFLEPGVQARPAVAHGQEAHDPRAVHASAVEAASSSACSRTALTPTSHAYRAA